MISVACKDLVYEHFFFGCVLERREGGGEGEKGDVIRWGRTFSLGLFVFMVIVLHYRLRTEFKEKKHYVRFPLLDCIAKEQRLNRLGSLLNSGLHVHAKH